MAAPVLICCSRGAQASLDTPVKALRNEGRDVEVMPGFEDDVRAFGRVLDANPGPGLYVVVQGLGLDQAIVRQLEGMFNARRGRDHRLAVVLLAPTDAMDILPHIRRALAGEEVRPPSPRKRSSNRWRTSTPRGDVVDPDALARRLNAEMENAEAALTRSSQHRVPLANDPAPTVGEPGSARPEPGEEIAIDIDVTDSRPAPARPRWLWPAVGAAAVVAVLGIVAGLGSGDPPPEHTPRERPVVAAAVPAPAEPTEVASPRPEPGEPAPAAETGTDGEAEDMNGPSYREREEMVIANAIARGTIHSLDRLLWASSHPNPISHAEAATLCADLSAGGVGHFRLPDGKEVKKLRRARMLEPGTYWSSTPTAEGSDQQWVLDTADVKLSKLSRIGGLARAVCVRDRKIVHPTP